MQFALDPKQGDSDYRFSPIVCHSDNIIKRRVVYSSLAPNSVFLSWRHQMETFSVLLALCAGNSLVSGEFPSQRPVTRSFRIFFDLRLNKAWVNKREAGDLRRYGPTENFIVSINAIHYYIDLPIRSLGPILLIEINLYSNLTDKD